MVSVDKNDNILGYFSVCIERPANKVNSIGAINFGKLNITFKDFYKFLDSLFIVHNFNKVEWCVVIGNPAEKMYDKIIKSKYHGKVVGINHESTILEDGKLYDVKEYELFKKRL